jgi:hypothetical protein
VESVELLEPDEQENVVLTKDNIDEQDINVDKTREADKEAEHAELNEISFRVQVSISSQRFSQAELEDRIGSKLKYGVKILETGNMFKYQSGSFNTYSEAAAYLIELKNNGVKDSFIVAYNKGSQISIKDARAISGK